VTNSNHTYAKLRVFNAVDDPIVADTNAPLIATALELLAAIGRGSTASPSIREKIFSTTVDGSHASSFKALGLISML
jgi:hypothetical protein